MSYAKIVAIGWSEYELAGPNLSCHRLNLKSVQNVLLEELISDSILVRGMCLWP